MKKNLGWVVTLALSIIVTACTVSYATGGRFKAIETNRQNIQEIKQEVHEEFKDNSTDHKAILEKLSALDAKVTILLHSADIAGGGNAMVRKLKDIKAEK
jgi:hypothetical protein